MGGYVSHAIVALLASLVGMGEARVSCGETKTAADCAACASSYGKEACQGDCMYSHNLRACVIKKDMQTEAEDLNFDLTGLPLPFLGKKGAQKVVNLLKDDLFSFLGSWRTNQSLIQEINMQIVSGAHHLIDGFLNAAFVDKLFNEILTYATSKEMQINSFGVDIDQIGLDLNAYHRSKDPQKRCNLLYRGIQDGTLLRDDGAFHHHFRHFGFNDLDGNGEDYPAIKLMHYGMQNLKWMQALNLLLTGSGKRIRNKPELRVQKKFPFFREFQVGDYALLHNDMAPNAQGDTRGLSINGWLASPEWNPEWGGNFLWCGSHMQKDAKGQLFSDAERTPPMYNHAGLFLPHNETWHAVEIVEDSKPSDKYRFSFKFDYEIYTLEPDPGILKHSDVLVKKQATLRKQRVSSTATTATKEKKVESTKAEKEETSDDEPIRQALNRAEERRKSLSKTAKEEKVESTNSEKEETADDEPMRQALHRAEERRKSLSKTAKDHAGKAPKERSNDKVLVTLNPETKDMLQNFQVNFASRNADSLKIKDIPQLLAEYKQLAKFFTMVQQQWGKAEIV